MERYAGRYGILKKLGEGGMGEVRLAVDLDTGAQVAIKRLTLPDEEQAIEIMRGEFEALARLRHPAIVRVLELGTDFEGRPFLVMEYVVGWASQIVVQPGRTAELAALAVRVASGLEAIHAAGIAHGDLKPENILVKTPERGDLLRDIRIVDFGLSGRAGAGTPGYSAPDVIRGAKAGPLDDLYSFGATLFRLASGRDPFDAPNDDERLRRQLAGPPSSLSLEEAEVPAGWIRLILQLLATNPNERPRSATDLRRAIEVLAPAVRIPLADRIAGETLVGRERELARLEREWKRSQKGARSLVLTGESGIGKSALLEAFAARGVIEKRSVIRVAGISGGPPGGTWRAAARRIAAEARVDLAGAPVELRDALHELAGEPDESVQTRVEAAIADWCRRITDRGYAPCILVDDADVIDSVSLRCLRRSMLAGASAPAFWLLARRSDGEFADEQERLMVEAGTTAVIVVPPLERPEVERLVAARLGGEPSPPLLQFVWDRAAGHPGLTVESLRAAASAGAVREEEFGFLIDETALIGLPPLADFESMRLERVQALDEKAQRAAQVIGAFGRPVVASQILLVDPSLVESSLAPLLTQGIASRDQEGRWTLTPAALGPRLLASMPHVDRCALHLTLLERGGLGAVERFHHLVGAGDVEGALAASEAAFSDSPGAELSLQVARLAEPRDATLAARWMTRGARALMDRGRYRDAAPFLQKALLLGGDASARGECWGMLSACRFRSGDLGMLEQETEMARREPLGAAARATLQVNEAARLWSQGKSAEALVVARNARALADSSGDISIRGPALLTEANALVHLDQLDEASRTAASAREAFARARDAVGAIRSAGLLALIQQRTGDLNSAEALLRSQYELATKGQFRLALEEIAGGYFNLLVAVGKWPEARTIRSLALRQALEDGREHAVASAMINIAQLDGLMGEMAAARRETRLGVLLCRRHAPRNQSLALRTRALVLRASGRLAEAQRIVEKAARVSRTIASQDEVDWSLIEHARIRARGGNWVAVHSLARVALNRVVRRGSVADVALAAFAARGALRLQGANEAESLLSKIEAWPRNASGTYAVAFMEQLRAEIALVKGDAQVAEEIADDALKAFSSLPASPEHAAAALEFARLGIERGSASASAIERWLDEAQAGFDRLGDRRGRDQSTALAMRWYRDLSRAQGFSGKDTNLIRAVEHLLDSLSDFAELTSRSMRLAVNQLDAERGVLLLRDPESNELRVCAEYGAVDAVTKRKADEISRQAVERALGSGDSLVIHDPTRIPNANTASVLRLGIKSILCVPMFHGGQAIGAVYLDDSRRHGAFTESDRQLIEGFAGLMAIAIIKSRGADEVRRNNEQLRDENLSLRREVERRSFQPEGFIGKSLAMSKVLDVVQRAADLSTTVLITGENGTGKERIARILHYSGKRKNGPFVAINCGAIPGTLLESELFGHARGAFTGAERDRDGKFVQANRGTLFLDEIGEMPVTQQASLLSVLETREVTPVGGNRPIRVDVRVIAATNQNLLDLISEKKFRQDLYERLHVLPLEIPPLREHKADIPDLAQHFAVKFAELQERPIPEFSPEFVAKLMQSDWPGNVRELQNYIERVMALTPGVLLRPDPLPRDLESRGVVLLKHGGLDHQLEVLEKRLLEQTLEQADWNQSKAARVLKLKEQTLRYRLKKHNLGSGRNNSRPRKKRR